MHKSADRGGHDWMCAALVGVVLTLLVSSATCRAVEAADHPHAHADLIHEETINLHPIDVCIFSCDLCFKSEALVQCANECILSDGAMDVNWRRICKIFDAPHPLPSLMGFI